jgi:hypothetical protein
MSPISVNQPNLLWPAAQTVAPRCCCAPASSVCDNPWTHFTVHGLDGFVQVVTTEAILATQCSRPVR